MEMSELDSAAFLWPIEKPQLRESYFMFAVQHLVGCNYKLSPYLQVYNCDHKVVKINQKCVGIVAMYTIPN
jgi:hypothetical protein